MTAPVWAELEVPLAKTWLAVPVIEVTALEPIVPLVIQVEQAIVIVPPEIEVAIGDDPVKVLVPPKEVAEDEPESAAKVIDELAKSVLATDPSTIEAELTEAVVIRPFTSTAKRSVLAALFWPSIKNPAGEVSVFLFK